MDACIFDVFADRRNYDLSFLRDRVDFEFFGILDEFREDDRMVGRDDRSFFQVFFELLFIPDDIHGCSR